MCFSVYQAVSYTSILLWFGERETVSLCVPDSLTVLKLCVAQAALELALPLLPLLPGC